MLQNSPCRHRQWYLDAAFMEFVIGHKQGTRCSVFQQSSKSPCITVPQGFIEVFWEKVLRKRSQFRNCLEMSKSESECYEVSAYVPVLGKTTTVPRTYMGSQKPKKRLQRYCKTCFRVLHLTANWGENKEKAILFPELKSCWCKEHSEDTKDHRNSQ